jgi:hypothetical protein
MPYGDAQPFRFSDAQWERMQTAVLDCAEELMGALDATTSLLDNEDWVRRQSSNGLAALRRSVVRNRPRLQRLRGEIVAARMADNGTK